MYSKIDESYSFLPENARRTFYYLKKEDWILNYKNMDFIENVLFRMGNHYKNGDILTNSIRYLKSNPNFYEDNFFKFIDTINIENNCLCVKKR